MVSNDQWVYAVEFAPPPDVTGHDAITNGVFYAKKNASGYVNVDFNFNPNYVSVATIAGFNASGGSDGDDALQRRVYKNAVTNSTTIALSGCASTNIPVAIVWLQFTNNPTVCWVTNGTFASRSIMTSDSDVDANINWSISGTPTATISTNGVVTFGTGGGTYTVTAAHKMVTNLTAAYTLTVRKVILTSATVAAARDGTTNARTYIGVLEQVNLSADTSVAWTNSNSAGHLSGYYGSSAVFDAPLTNATVAVTALDTNCGCSSSISFTVVAPTGITALLASALTYVYDDNCQQYYMKTDGSEAGVSMYVRPYLLPASVSFGNIDLMELGTNATEVSGYFTNHGAGPHGDGGNCGEGGASIDISEANVWDALFDYAGFAGTILSPPYSIGAFQWDIPGVYMEHGTTAPKITLAPSPWTQTFSIDTNGTMTVSKFGAYVRRGASGTNYVGSGTPP